MRYRAEVADRPDALYAVWDGRVFRAQRSTADGTLLLVPAGDEEAPDGFDTEWNGRPAKVVPEGEATSTYSLHTLCRYDDELFHVAPDSADGELTLRWTGRDERTAAELGLVDLSTTTSDPESITALWQERHDLGQPGPRQAGGDGQALLRAIGRTLVRALPNGWQRVGAQFRQAGDYAELEVRAVADVSGTVIVSLAAPPELSQLFAALRAAMYEPATGTWLQGTFTLDAASTFDFDYDNDVEPSWRRPPGTARVRGYDAELERFPRERKNVPGWLAARAGLPLEVTFRHARVVDGHTDGEPPVVNRQPVPAEEVRAVLGYLYRAPIVLSRPGTHPDIFAPNGPADTPDAFHTDGSWIWPAAVPHYLRKYGLPPDPELLDHIRANNHRPPYVGDRLRATAEAEAQGKPYPPQQDSDLFEPGRPAEVERGGEPRNLLASEVLSVLRTRLAELGVHPAGYRIGASADGAWCLRRTDHGWEVARHAEGAPVEPKYFAEVEAAAAALLGSLLLYPGRIAPPPDQEAAEPATHATDWPILPLRGEPPLTFFRAKRMAVLPTGTRLVRFGNDAGNLVHAESTRFAETSLAHHREHERQEYVVARPLRVLTGVSMPWGGLPGGAIAYLLPRPIGHHVETGALTTAPTA